MTSGGFRLGSYLRWKYVIPVSDNKGEITAAKVIIYAEEEDEYFAFVTPEVYCTLKMIGL